ncbi:DUF362 domain-containing protein [Desulfitobacterium sp.]|uniref:DUF362 domain-containing protein n=1 Tax=Desulfitobacterium sp. TaxID=49981 RepID=UPI002C5BEAA1|nr:DUF362 domain-containing protein [Desulfitobacterium sp.]HVJ49069.1 DUF362 domain-containing protein [Desulfitobacterium sp.]
MSKSIVSMVSFEDPYTSLKKLIEECDGFAGLNPEDKILIKPNIVSWDFELPFPPFGVITTTTVIHALVRLLKENGFNHLTIGEGGLPKAHSQDPSVYQTIGYEDLAKQYGLELVDFNQGRFGQVDFGNFTLSIAQSVLDADKIINVPVLKTHNQAKVSLGIKNMKGVLSRKSKMFCHGLGEFDLLETFPRIIEKLPVALTIIDGVYTLEKGPGHTGKAFRKNLLIASRDPLACDLVGAEVLGYKGEEVPYLQDYAKRNRRSLSLDDLKIKGERLEEHRQFVDYDWEWTKENTGPIGFEKRGITGLAIRKYDNSLCTGCSVLFNPMLILMMSSFNGQPFPNIELVSGKSQSASEGFAKTILFGKCACDLNKDNPHIQQAIAVKGCPPDLKDFEELLRAEGIKVNYEEYVNYRQHIFDRYRPEDGFELNHWQVKEGTEEVNE